MTWPFAGAHREETHAKTQRRKGDALSEVEVNAKIPHAVRPPVANRNPLQRDIAEMERMEWIYADGRLQGTKNHENWEVILHIPGWCIAMTKFIKEISDTIDFNNLEKYSV